MSDVIWILGSTGLVCLLSFIGILTLSLKEKLLREITLLLVALSAGALIGGAFFHMIPESLEFFGIGGADILFSYVILGFVTFFILENFMHWRHCHEADCEIHSFGYMNLVGDGVHNFIDGLIIAAAFISDFKLGIATTITIIFHEIPQEIGDFGVLLHSGYKKSKAILFNFITAATVVVGGLVGFFASSSIENFVPMLLPIAAGGFIYIAGSDLIPELRKTADFKKSTLTFIVFLFGILLMWMTKLVFA